MRESAMIRINPSRTANKSLLCAPAASIWIIARRQFRAGCDSDGSLNEPGLWHLRFVVYVRLFRKSVRAE